MNLPATSRLFVWDTSGLLHYGRADRFDVLGEYVKGPGTERWRHVTTEIVAEELRRYDVPTPPWLDVHPLNTLAELTAFGDWLALLSNGVRDVGEASAAAWASVHDAVVVVDDRGAKAVITANGLDAHGSLWMLCQAIRHGLVDTGSVTALVNAALADGARMGFGTNGFVDWAKAKRLL